LTHFEVVKVSRLLCVYVCLYGCGESGSYRHGVFFIRLSNILLINDGVA